MPGAASKRSTGSRSGVIQAPRPPFAEGTSLPWGSSARRKSARAGSRLRLATQLLTGVRPNEATSSAFSWARAWRPWRGLLMGTYTWVATHPAHGWTADATPIRRRATVLSRPPPGCCWAIPSKRAPGAYPWGRCGGRSGRAARSAAQAATQASSGRSSSYSGSSGSGAGSRRRRPSSAINSLRATSARLIRSSACSSPICNTSARS